MAANSQTVHRIQAQDSRVPDLKLPMGALPQWDQRFDTIEFDHDAHPSLLGRVSHRLRKTLAEYGVPDKRELLGKYSSWNADGPDLTLPEGDRFYDEVLYADSAPWPEFPNPWNRSEFPPIVQACMDTLQDEWEREQRFFQNHDDSETLVNAPAFLQRELTDAQSERQVKEVYENRYWWYAMGIPYFSLFTALKKSNVGEILYPDSGYGLTTEPVTLSTGSPIKTVGKVVIPDETEVGDYLESHNLPVGDVVTVTELLNEMRTASGSSNSRDNGDDPKVPSDYGIELPAPVVQVTYPGNSKYLLIPWGDGLMCGGMFRHSKPFITICKHEAALAMLLGEGDYSPLSLPVHHGVTEVPHRCRRFVSPDIY